MGASYAENVILNRSSYALVGIAFVGAALFTLRQASLLGNVSSPPSSSLSNVGNNSTDTGPATWTLTLFSAHNSYGTGKIGSSDSILIFATGISRATAKTEVPNMTLTVALPQGMYLDASPQTVSAEMGGAEWDYPLGQGICKVRVWQGTTISCPLSLLVAEDVMVTDTTAPVGQMDKAAVRYSLQLSPRISAEQCGTSTTLQASLVRSGGDAGQGKSLTMTIPCAGACTDFCGGFGQDLCDAFHAPGCVWQANGMFVSANCIKTPQCTASIGTSSSAASSIATASIPSSAAVSSPLGISSSPASQSAASAVGTPSPSSSSAIAVPSSAPPVSSKPASSVPTNQATGGKKYCCEVGATANSFSCPLRDPYSSWNPQGWIWSTCSNAKAGTATAGYDTENGCAMACSPQRWCCSSDALQSPYSCKLSTLNASNQCPWPMIGTTPTGYAPTAAGQQACGSACVKSACCAADGSGGCTARAQCIPGGETAFKGQQCSPSLCCTGANREVKNGQCLCKNGYAEQVDDRGAKTCVAKATIACCDVDAGTCAQRDGSACVAPETKASQVQCSEGLCCSGGRAWKDGKCVCAQNQEWKSGKCSCIAGSTLQNGACQCPAGQVAKDGACQCPGGTTWKNGACVAEPWTLEHTLVTQGPIVPGQVVEHRVKITRGLSPYTAGQNYSVYVTMSMLTPMPSAILGGCQVQATGWMCPLPSIPVNGSVEFTVKATVAAEACTSSALITHSAAVGTISPFNFTVYKKVETPVACGVMAPSATPPNQAGAPVINPPPTPVTQETACCITEDNRPSCVMNDPDCAKKGFLPVPNTQCTFAACSQRLQRCCCRGNAPLGGKQSDTYGSCLAGGGTWMQSALTCGPSTCDASAAPATTAPPPALPPSPATPSAPPAVAPVSPARYCCLSTGSTCAIVSLAPGASCPLLKKGTLASGYFTLTLCSQACAPTQPLVPCCTGLTCEMVTSIQCVANKGTPKSGACTQDLCTRPADAAAVPTPAADADPATQPAPKPDAAVTAKLCGTCVASTPDACGKLTNLCVWKQASFSTFSTIFRLFSGGGTSGSCVMAPECAK